MCYFLVFRVDDLIIDIVLIFRDIGENEIDQLPEGLLQNSPNLRQIELKGNPLSEIHPDAFVQLPHLEKL